MGARAARKVGRADLADEVPRQQEGEGGDNGHRAPEGHCAIMQLTQGWAVAAHQLLVVANARMEARHDNPWNHISAARCAAPEGDGASVAGHAVEVGSVVAGKPFQVVQRPRRLECLCVQRQCRRSAVDAGASAGALLKAGNHTLSEVRTISFVWLFPGARTGIFEPSKCPVNPKQFSCSKSSEGKELSSPFELERTQSPKSLT